MTQNRSLASEPDLGEKGVWLMTPDEYAAQNVGRWITIPRDRTDAVLRQGVRYQITKEDAIEQHRSFIDTALTFDYSVPVASVQFHGLPLPKGYIQEGDFYVKPKRKTGKRKTSFKLDTVF